MTKRVKKKVGKVQHILRDEQIDCASCCISFALTLHSIFGLVFCSSILSGIFTRVLLGMFRQFSICQFPKMESKKSANNNCFCLGVASKTSWLKQVSSFLTESNLDLLSVYHKMQILFYLSLTSKGCFKVLRAQSYILANIMSHDSEKPKQAVALEYFHAFLKS